MLQGNVTQTDMVLKISTQTAMVPKISKIPEEILTIESRATVTTVIPKVNVFFFS
jgi:hypothetical protein